jgi:long-chain acyl-CoA synthetase
MFQDLEIVALPKPAQTCLPIHSDRIHWSDRDLKHVRQTARLRLRGLITPALARRFIRGRAPPRGDASLHTSVHALRTPEKPAFIMADSGQVVTFGQLEQVSNRFAQLLRAMGLVAGDRIALMLENNARFFELCIGAHRAGIIFTAISSRLTVAEAAYIIEDCDAKLFITSTALSEVAGALARSTPRVARRLMVDGVIDGYESYEAAVAAQPDARIADETAGGDMLYSSGTTGRPKGVFVPPDSALIDAPTPLLNLCANHYGMGPDTMYLSPAPLYHAAPLRFTLTTMRLGGTVVVMEHFDAENYLRLVQKYRITHTQLVPTMFVRMLKLPEAVRSLYDVSSLKFAIHAAAPCPIPVKEKMIQWWGPVIWEYYAGTEGNGMTLVDSAGWLSHKGTVGRAVIGKLRILDPEGDELPVGEPGTVYFAEGRPFQYHKDPEKTEQSKSAQGWTTLGDIGYVDADGYLYLTDRKANMIISGGVNIYPQECENLLVTHPKVVDVAVFGVPNEEFGEEVKAVVQPRNMNEAGPALAEELIVFCRQHLSPIKCPRSIDFESELPRHPTGKLYKRLLRDRYWAGRDNKLV